MKTEQETDGEPKSFSETLYDMQLGERISDNMRSPYGFNWVITRVPGGWIYTAEQAMSPCSVFVPCDNGFDRRSF